MRPEIRQHFDACDRLSEKLHLLLGGRTIRTFAKDVGIPYGTIQTWFAGESLPGDLEKSSIVAGWLGMTLDEFKAFLDGANPKPREASLEEILALASQLPEADKMRLLHTIMGQLVA